MKRRFSSRLVRFLDAGALFRWTRMADAAPGLDLRQLAQVRARAGALRRRLDRLIHVADGRLALPHIGSNAIQKPLGTDWAYRPEPWRGTLPRPGQVAVESRTAIGGEATIFHDCKVSELTFRQLRNTRQEDLAPFGIRMDVFRFDGSFLSLVVDLPADGARGLKKQHIIRLDTIIEIEKPIEIFVRLNVKHGPNTEQIVRELAMDQDRLSVEFDLAYTRLNEKRVEKMWLDLIFEDPELNQIVLRDLTITRRPRADL